MVSFALFIFSGITLATLLLAKRVENRSGRRGFLLRAISKSDRQIRELFHRVLDFYSLGRERSLFIIQKQLPMRAKRELGKAQTYIQEKIEGQFGNVRNARLIKKQEGISEFFKNISEIEKGGGELHEEIYAPYAGEVPEATVTISPEIEPVITVMPEPKKEERKPRVVRKRAPAKKKIPPLVKLVKPATPRRRRLQVKPIEDTPTDLF